MSTTTTPATRQNAVNWFELFVSDFDRAKRFYEAILDTKLEDVAMEGAPMSLFPCAMAEGGIGGSITQMDGHKPGPGGTRIYLNVEGDLDGVLARAPAHGGAVIQPRTSIGEHGFIGIIQDSEGNHVGLHSMS